MQSILKRIWEWFKEQNLFSSSFWVLGHLDPSNFIPREAFDEFATGLGLKPLEKRRLEKAVPRAGFSLGTRKTCWKEMPSFHFCFKL